jgi:hypothetical protein
MPTTVCNFIVFLELAVLVRGNYANPIETGDWSIVDKIRADFDASKSNSLNKVVKNHTNIEFCAPSHTLRLQTITAVPKF